MNERKKNRREMWKWFGGNALNNNNKKFMLISDGKSEETIFMKTNVFWILNFDILCIPNLFFDMLTNCVLILEILLLNCSCLIYGQITIPH